MLGRELCVAAVLLLGFIPIAASQNFPAIDPQTGAAPPIVHSKNPMTTAQPPAQNFPAIDSQTGAAPPIVRPKKPMKQASPENTSDQAIPSTGAPTTAGQERKTATQDALGTAAQRQSGLSEVQARSLLRQQGYNSVNTLQAQPNSIWVWQADAMKNGRPVRLGIDYRGKVLELGATATPCTVPGINPTGGGFGAGARLAEASRCSGR